MVDPQAIGVSTVLNTKTKGSTGFRSLRGLLCSVSGASKAGRSHWSR